MRRMTGKVHGTYTSNGVTERASDELGGTGRTLILAVVERHDGV